MNAPVAPESSVPARTPGSLLYFVVLYTPAPQRLLLKSVLALAEEISAGVDGSADHAVAHVRLEWWRQEAQRWNEARAQHPWLRALQSSQPLLAQHLNLLALVDAAIIDLANHSQASGAEPVMRGALYRVLGQALCSQALPAAAQQRLLECGMQSLRLQRLIESRGADGAQLEATSALLYASLAGIEPVRRAPLAPLLIWSGLLLHQARRRVRRRRSAKAMQASRWDGLNDNLFAWRIARRAARGKPPP